MTSFYFPKRTKTKEKLPSAKKYLMGNINYKEQEDLKCWEKNTVCFWLWGKNSI